MCTVYRRLPTLAVGYRVFSNTVMTQRRLAQCSKSYHGTGTITTAPRLRLWSKSPNVGGASLYK